MKKGSLLAKLLCISLLICLCISGCKKTCETCSGEGTVECSDCTGSGTVKCRDCTGSGKVDCPDCDNGYKSCNTCDGTGEVETDGEECSACEGEGYSASAAAAWYVNQLASGKSISQIDAEFDKTDFPCSVCNGEGKTYDIKDCPDCKGTGYSEELCSTCNGNTSVVCETCSGEGTVECSECAGSGKVECPDCNGEGKVEN